MAELVVEGLKKSGSDITQTLNNRHEHRRRRRQSFYDIEIEPSRKNTEEAVSVIEEIVFANGPASI
jgi:hypothetical protein